MDGLDVDDRQQVIDQKSGGFAPEPARDQRD